MPEISTYMGHIEKFKSSESVFDNEPGLIYETRKKMFELAQHAHKFTLEEENFLETMYKKYL